MEVGALALGGRQSIKTPNNQPRVGGSSRGDVIAEAGGRGGTGGDPVQSFGAANGTTKKINNIKCIVAFCGRWLIILHTTTNQKMGGRGRGEGGEEGQTWGSGRGIPMHHICVWKVRGGSVPHHRRLQVAGS